MTCLNQAGQILFSIPQLCLILRLVCADLQKAYQLFLIPFKILFVLCIYYRWWSLGTCNPLAPGLIKCSLVLLLPPDCRSQKADIIFLIDGSESISSEDFEKIKDFVKRMVNQSNIGADKIQIGLLQFSSTPREEFTLKNNYSSKDEMCRAISNVTQINSGTETGKALNFTLPFFDISQGGRPGVHQYLIVITDGDSHDDIVSPAKALRDRNIIIFAIGVGKIQRAQLLAITNDQDKVYHEENFESLQNLEKEILYEVCTSQGE